MPQYHLRHNGCQPTLLPQVQEQPIEGIGFEFNLYDPCVANKMIEGKQMTICFHVDDCKTSHVSTKAVDEMIEWLKAGYVKIWEDGTGKMKVSRGKVHKYLGMTLDFSIKKVVKITMFDYIEEIVSAFQALEPTLGTKPNLVQPPKTCSPLTKTAPSWMLTRLRLSTTLSPRSFMPPSGLVRTHALPFRFSPPWCKHPTMMNGRNSHI